MNTSPRRIGYILSMKGGLPSFNFREIEEVEKRGFEIHVFPTKVSKGLYDPKNSWKIHRPNVLRAFASCLYWLATKPAKFLRVLAEAITDKGLAELALAAQFSRDMRRNGVELIHCHFADRKMFVTYFCSILAEVPFTVTIHSHELVFYIDRKLFSKALAQSSKIITVCDYNRMILLAKGLVPAEKVITLRLFLPGEDFLTDPRMKVLTVAKFYEYKGFDVLVDAARMLKEEPVVFWIVGDGPIDVGGMAGDLVLSGKMKLLGPVNEDLLKILYQACDVFCLPSKIASNGQKEGLPVSIMEAMAYSKPIVSTRHAGIPELVDTMLVSENDPRELSLALEFYMNDPGKRIEDGGRNRRKVEELHGRANIERLVEEFRSKQ